jgi:hypothetical protein
VQDLLIGGAVTGGSGGTTLRAGNHVTVGGAVTAGGTITLTADTNGGGVGDVNINAAVQATGSAAVQMSGRNFTQGGSGTISSGSGNITGTMATMATVTRAISSSSGTTKMSAPTVNLSADIAGAITGGVATVVNVSVPAQLQDAVGLAATTATVNVAAGIYTGGVNAVTNGKAITLAAGAGPGQVTIRGDFSLNAGDSLPIELNGPAAATNYDNFIVTGAVSLADATLNILVGYSPVSGEQFTILDKTSAGPVSGTFLNRAEGAPIFTNNNATVYSITYVGGDGNDIVLAGPPPNIVRITQTSETNFTVTSTGNVALPLTVDYTTNLLGPQNWQTTTASSVWNNGTNITTFTAPPGVNPAYFRMKQAIGP